MRRRPANRSDTLRVFRGCAGSGDAEVGVSRSVTCLLAMALSLGSMGCDSTTSIGIRNTCTFQIEAGIGVDAVAPQWVAIGPLETTFWFDTTDPFDHTVTVGFRQGADQVSPSTAFDSGDTLPAPDDSDFDRLYVVPVGICDQID